MNVLQYVWLAAGAVICVVSGADETVSYGRDIRPILSNACFQCHGPDESGRKAGLRLDTPDGRSGGAIVAGNPEDSEVLRRIVSADPDERMPPPEAGEALTPEQVELVRRWIAEGAQWSDHWSFEAPKAAAPPADPFAGWARNPIDGFIANRMTDAGLTPNPEADRTTLLRRLSLDITGLPPTVEDIAQAEADGDAVWYDNAVERLLASPHYGERWARMWLDASQYADSDGFEKDKPRFVWHWRDWVVNAMNADMPYDRFVIEQVAGDMLPGATINQRIATGFLRNSMINEEGGIDPEQFRMEAQFNRMDIVGQAVLGLTVQCAQCHTHKYDPLTHTDYYRMLSFLNNAYDACITVYTAEEEAQRDRILALAAEVANEAKGLREDWAEAMGPWEEALRAESEPAWEALEFTVDDSSSGGQKFTPQGDGSYLAQGYAPTRFQPKMTAQPKTRRITALKLELLTDPQLPRNGPGRSIYGTSALSEIELRSGAADTPISDYDKWTPAPFASAIADVNPAPRPLGPEYPDRENRERITGPVSMAIDGNGDTAWTTDVDPMRRNQPHTAIFRLKEPLVLKEGEAVALRLAQLHGGWNSDDNQTNNLGRFRVSVTDADETPSRIVPPAVRAALAVPSASRSASDRETLFAYWMSEQRDLAETYGRLEALWAALPNGTTQLVLQERETPRLTHRLDRGDFLSPAEPVTPGTPDFLHALTTEGTPDRLDFAQWLVDRDAPTTARAYVNRVWQQYFGRGLVETPSDLGLQGEAPTHPELLDWLAVRFMDSGWKVKDLHRLIVGSATYRQASHAAPQDRERDPYNRLLARGARFRVEGETVRDIALTASGLLNRTLGGPSVYPPAPDYLFQPPASYGPKIWRVESGADRYRRALYTFRFRSVPLPTLQAFDTPPGDAPCTRRVRSNSPLQALATLNETLFFETARGLGAAMLREGGPDDASRIAYGFRRCVTRAPDAAEVALMTDFLDAQRARLAAGELDAQAILDGGGGELDPKEAAAWTLLARAMLNLDETITRQ